MKHGKKFRESLEKIDRHNTYSLDEAIDIVKDSKANFDESIEISVNLGVDPRKSDQMIRGAVSLPYGTGKTKRVLVLTKSKQSEAEKAGADYVGFNDYIEKIKEGWLDFDAVIATPDAMSEVGKLGRILGPRGLMPNPKIGTVTDDIENAVKDTKAGKIEFKVDKYGILHTIIGKVSFEKEKLIENALSFISTIMKMRPSSAKGTYLKKITFSSTMGVGVKVDKNDILNRLK